MRNDNIFSHWHYHEYISFAFKTSGRFLTLFKRMVQ